MRLREPRVLATVVAAGTLLALIGQYAGAPRLAWLAGALTTAALSWVAWRRGGRNADTGTRLVLAGLLAALAGDLLPIGATVPRLGTFWLATALWCAAFAHKAGFLARWQPFAAAGIVAGALGIALGQALGPAGLAATLAWLVVPALMAGQAHARAAIAPHPEHRRAALGATLLLLSAALRVTGHYHAGLEAGPAAMLISYWAGLTLVTLSTPEAEPMPERPRLQR